MDIQKTDWGQIEWLSFSNSTEQKPQGMNVGIVTIEAGGYNPPHLHYDEQMLYVLEGEAECKINGQEFHMEPGGVYFWPAGVIDEIRCVSNGPFRHLLASNPVNGQITDSGENEQKHGDEKPALVLSPEERVRLLYVAVEAMRTQFLESLQYACVIFDCEGHMAYKSKYFPTRCMQCCSPSVMFGASVCMIHAGGETSGHEKESFLCRHGMELFNTPIYFRGQFLGTVMGGFIWQSELHEKRVEGVYDRPHSHIVAIQSLMDRIAKSIRNFCEFYQFREQLTKQERMLNTQLLAQKTLEQDIRKAEYALIDLKINHHFLFNTLNSMAAMALKGGNAELYQSILNLSDLFRSSLQVQGEVVELEVEVRYLKSYLQLQGIRYRNMLEVEYDIDESLYSFTVPHNFMQPIVENAFVHGFTHDEHKKVFVGIYRMEADDRIKVVLGNSGAALSVQECRAILLGMQSGTSHGLSIIYQKLEHVYGDAFTFEIDSGVEHGTEMTITFPTMGGKEGGER
ncbi:MAG: histidine kinase [Lachnospiraceae bacterium]|nr:histidine kinase [Lachnospiraceae bacterium]